MTTVPVGAPQSVDLGNRPCENRVAFRHQIVFAAGLSQDIDYAIMHNQNWAKSIQSLYVNNKGNTAEVILQFNGTKQSITIPANAQAYLPILDANTPTITVSCTNAAATVYIQALNFFVPPFMWNQSQTITITSLDAIIVNARLNVRTTPQALVADTNRSGTIAAGGTGQILMAANAARAQWSLQNPSTATEILQFSKSSIAGPWYDLVAGGQAADDGSTVYAGTIWVIAATTGHAFTSDEGTV